MCPVFCVYLSVRTCELFLCFAPFVFLGFFVLTSLFSLFSLTCKFFYRFLHWGWASSFRWVMLNCCWKHFICIKCSLSIVIFCKAISLPVRNVKKMLGKSRQSFWTLWCNVSVRNFCLHIQNIIQPVQGVKKVINKPFVIAVSFYLLNRKPLVCIFLEKVTYM